MLPPLHRTQWDLLAATIAGADGGEHLRRQIASTGLKALALYLPPSSAAPAAGPSLPAACEVGDVVAILRACQTAEDEPAVLKDLCGRIRSQLHAAAVGVVTSRNGRCDVLVGNGAGLDGDISERAIAAGITIAPHRCGDRTEAAAPVQYGGAPIAALCARWTVGSTYDLSRAASVLTMAATAAAPLVSAALVRRNQPASAALGGLIGVDAGDGGAAARHRARGGGAVCGTDRRRERQWQGAGRTGRSSAWARAATARSSTLNCAALPDDLVEAELFGHARGSFTGAVSERAGVFEEAHGGTLFLDEIGELSLRAQAKVLRVIQEGELRRIGENASRRIDVRIVAATNRDLLQRKSTRGASGSTCCTGSTSFASRCRRCASGAKTSRCWPNTSGAKRPSADGQPRRAQRGDDGGAGALRLARERPRVAERTGSAGRAQSEARRRAADGAAARFRATARRRVVAARCGAPRLRGTVRPCRAGADRRASEPGRGRAWRTRQGLTKLMTRLGIVPDESDVARLDGKVLPV